MDAESLLMLQLGTLSPDDSVRIPSDEQIQAYKTEHPLEYVLGLVEISVSTQDPSHIHMVITNLYSVCRHSDILIQDSILGPFFERFAEAVQTLFLATYVPQRTKNLIGNILAEVTNALHKHDSSNTQIQEYFMQLIQSNIAYAPAIIHTISEVLEASDDICNFNVPDLLALLELQTETLPKAKLYFALAPHIQDEGESENIHAAFESMLQLIASDPENLAQVFRVIAHFAEKHSKFFAPHLDVFPIFIAERITQTDDPDIKREGIYIFQNMADNEPEMCSSNESFFQSAIDVLIRTMSTADETNCYDPNENSNDPCIIARQVFEPITKNIASEKSFQYLNQIKANVIEGDQNQELVYGTLMAIGEAAPLLMTFAMPDIKSKSDIQIEETFFYSTLEFIVAGSTIPAPFRYASYCAATSFANYLGPVFQDITHERYLEPIVELVSEEEPPVAKACFRFLKKYLKRWKIDGIAPYYSSLEAAFLEFLRQCEDPDLIVLILGTLGVLVGKMIITSPVPVEINYDEIIEILNTLVQDASENALTIQVHTIQCFSQILSKQLIDSNDSDEITELISAYFQKALEIDSSNECPPLLIPKLGKSIQKLMIYLGNNFNTYAGYIVQEALQTLEKLPKPQEYAILDPVITSGLYYVPNSKPGTRTYFENNDIAAIKTALTTLSIAAMNSKTNFAQFFENALPLIYQLIEQPEFINPIQEEAFKCLTQLILSQIDNPENFFPLIPAFIEHFKAQAVMPWKPSSLSIFLKSASELAKSAYKILKANRSAGAEQVAPMFNQLFETIDYLKNDLDNKKQQKHNEQVQFDLNEPATPDFSQIADAQSSLCYLYKRVGKIDPAQAIEFYREHLSEKINQQISNPLLSTNALEFLMRYIIFTGDEAVLQEYIEVLLGILTDTEKFAGADTQEEDDDNDMRLYETDSDNFNVILEGLIGYFIRFPISNELGIHVLEVLKNLFDENFMMKNIFASADDCIKIAFCAITMKNPELVSPEDRISLLSDSLIIQGSNKYNFIIPWSILKSLETEYEEWDTGEENISVKDEDLADLLASFFSFYKPDYLKEKMAQSFISYFYKIVRENQRFHQRLLEYVQYIRDQDTPFTQNCFQNYNYFSKICMDMKEKSQRQQQMASTEE